MKIQNILTIASVLGVSLFAGQVSADVAGYVSNKNVQTVNAGTSKWLDLYPSGGNQIIKSCKFRAGPAAVHFSAETSKSGGGNSGWLGARIWLDHIGSGPGKNPFWLTASGLAIDSAPGGDSYEAHAIHGGFIAKAGWYRVKVRANSVGNAKYRIDDTSLICNN